MGIEFASGEVARTRDGRWTDRAVLGAFLAFTAVAVVGYGTYGLHPELLPQSERSLAFFTVSFELFARAHIVVAALALGWMLVGSVGLRWLIPFAAVYALSFTAEHVGTGHGIPFGGYAYTGLLGPKLGGRVPALIPVSWFLMALPSWVLARRGFREARWSVGRVVLGATWLTAWDLALDPAMSFLTPYWSWAEAGPYYGMPLVNLAGWFLTGLVLLSVLETLSGWARLDALDSEWMLRYYGVMLLMPLGMLAAAGLWLGVTISAGAVVACWWVSSTGLLRARRAELVDRSPLAVNS